MKNLALCFIAVSALIVSCNEKFDQLNQEEIQPFDIEQEVAFPDRSGEISTFELKNSGDLSYELIDSLKVFEGDIFLDEELIGFLKKEDTTISSSNGRVASAPGAILRRWNNSSVNFRITLSSRRTDILWAINHIEANTNIDFNESATGNYIDFVSSTGCSSFLGMQGGRQPINLASGCSRGSIVHEICHALGVFHEQSRPDRGNHIIINWGNIESGMAFAFETRLAHNYGNFDFGSIMMYSSWAFSSNGNPTITRRNGSTFTAQRTGLSTTDINALRDMYPGPNMIRSKGGTIDVGVNGRGDIAYSKKNRFYVDIYKKDVRVSRIRTTGDISVDITSSGSVIKTGNFTYGSGKYRNYRMLDISEGGGDIYCIATNTKETRLFRKNGSSWTKVSGSGKRLTVDQRGRPWLLSDRSIAFLNGSSFTTIGMPPYSSTYDRLVDIGSAGNEIYVSMRNIKNGNKQLLKYSAVANQLIRQPGSANRLDGQSNGVMWIN